MRFITGSVDDNSDPSNPSQDVTSKGGWYTWDPIVLEAKYAYLSYTPDFDGYEPLSRAF